MADETRLSERAEQLLASLPIPERDWEKQAQTIEARLSATALGSTDAHWLQPPFPEDPALAPALSLSASARGDAEVGPTETPFPFASMPSIVEAPESTPDGAEAPAASRKTSSPPQPVAASTAPEAPVPSAGGSQSLSALARSVAQKSGRPQAREIARESLSVAAAARSHSDARAERVRSARPMPPPPSHRPGQVPSAPPATPAANNAQLGPWIAVGGLAIAAAIALWVLARPPAPPQVAAAPEPSPVNAQLPVPQPQAAPTAVARSEPAEVAKLAPRAALEGAAAPSMAASALPLAPRVAVGGGSVRSATGAAQSGARSAAPVSSVAALARPAPESIVLEDTPAQGKPTAPGKPTPQAATSGLRPAAGSPAGGLPDRPATGAVQAAIGSVMGAARACVAGGVATPAQVTFRSSGVVEAVTVSGPNAGTPAASCIDAALRRARVGPFTSPTFSLMVWVRP